MESWSIRGCTIMSDMWTDIKERIFINIIGYSPKGDVFLNSFECSDVSKTGLFLRDILELVIERVGSEKVVQLISDNTSNYRVAISLIMEKYPHIQRIKCAAHGVQLLLKDIDAEIPWVKEVFEKAKLIVTFMYKHETVLALMRETTNNRELKKPCKTRFASNFLMLKSILEVEDLLRVMVASAEWRANRHCNSEMVLRLVDGDGATSPFLYEAMQRARNTIIDRCNRDSSNYKMILQLFDSRKNENILNHVHVAAAFLNPLLMCEGKISYYNDDVGEAMVHIVRTMIFPHDKKQFVMELKKYYEKDEKLSNDISKEMIDSHPHK
ncbi:uncharacterized protein LOC122086762 [Macadamia integrifolia]|uniref:uncharacterized protein LOC122086762 n=1 Tax=Macadamia integrifolia TaxID=60698 RepID=UPI001C4E9CB2|nr:uncharacterized protein LOC122086762 [Macadamia integrifolia]